MVFEEDDLKVFIKAVERYFSKLFGENALVDPPFMHGDESLIQHYTGYIGISGRQRGAVMFTASEIMVRKMCEAFGESPDDTEIAADIVGEVTNTLSGNVRSEFGGEFVISVPVVTSGSDNAPSFPKKTTSFIIPFIWRHYRAYLIVCLGEPQSGILQATGAPSVD